MLQGPGALRIRPKRRKGWSIAGAEDVVSETFAETPVSENGEAKRDVNGDARASHWRTTKKMNARLKPCFLKRV
jgi:hypothetical protein